MTARAPDPHTELLDAIAARAQASDRHDGDLSTDITALHEAGVSQVELARRPEVDDKEARRLLDPRHPSKLPRLEQALAALGKRLDVRVVDRVA